MIEVRCTLKQMILHYDILHRMCVKSRTRVYFPLNTKSLARQTTRQHEREEDTAGSNGEKKSGSDEFEFIRE